MCRLSLSVAVPTGPMEWNGHDLVRPNAAVAIIPMGAPLVDFGDLVRGKLAHRALLVLCTTGTGGRIFLRVKVATTRSTS
jgi:hypothetical protein